jgi:hypothetical protein
MAPLIFFVQRGMHANAGHSGMESHATNDAKKRWVHWLVHWEITIQKMKGFQLSRRWFDSAPGHHDFIPAAAPARLRRKGAPLSAQPRFNHAAGLITPSPIVLVPALMLAPNPAIMAAAIPVLRLEPRPIGAQHHALDRVSRGKVRPDQRACAGIGRCRNRHGGTKHCTEQDTHHAFLKGSFLESTAMGGLFYQSRAEMNGSAPPVPEVRHPPDLAVVWR